MMINLKESTRVSRYDGQVVQIDGQAAYELGAYLGGGASGVVYEATSTKTKQRVALKILHPLGFKVARGGLERYNEITNPKEEIRWFMHPSTRDVIATGIDLKELTLLKCVEIWGFSLPKEELTDAQLVESLRQGRRNGLFPPKYTRFLKQRELVFREISSMRRVSGHRNVLRLDDVLELVQESKLTFFLVLELAGGGELFDRITADEGCEEEVARGYVTQLLKGVSYCHSKGVCHRDLKPENLLLSQEGDILKIADFGLSTLMFHENNQGSMNNGSLRNPDPLRRLISVVGSSHYIAPEVLSKEAYDGTKADAWSIGVILYALLAGSLPFGKELLTCPRFLTFSRTLKESSAKNGGTRFYLGEYDAIETLRAELDWFFPAKLSKEAVSLIIGFLDPNPVTRMTVHRALSDVWFQVGTTIESNILLEDDERMMDVEEEVDLELEAEDMFDIEMEKSTPLPASRNVAIKNTRVTALKSQPDLARSAPALPDKKVSSSMSMSFTSPPLAPRESYSPASEELERSPSEEKGNRSRIVRKNSEIGKPSTKGRSRSTSPMAPRKNADGAVDISTDAPMFHEAMKRTTIFTTSVPANQVLGKLAKIVTELGSVSPRIDWERYQLEIVQNDNQVLVCTVQIFLSREIPGPVYIVEFVRGPEYEIFEFKAFYHQVTQLLNLSNIVRQDHTHTLRY